jgi:hypothetical protein
MSVASAEHRADRGGGPFASLKDATVLFHPTSGDHLFYLEINFTSQLFLNVSDYHHWWWDGKVIVASFNEKQHR